MNVRAIAFLVCVGLAAPVAAEPTTRAQLSEVRERVHALEGATSKLRDLMSQYVSLLDSRPAGGKSPEAKKAQDKWQRALDRLLRRVGKAHAQVLEATQRLDQAAKGVKLPTSLGKDVASARNDAEATRGSAQEALAKHKPKPASKSKNAKAAKAAPAPQRGDADPLRGLDR